MSIKLLVADDSITIQKVIGIIFGGEDYSLTVVDNGKSAIEKAREICPDVLLIDALMPGMTGYEVSEAVRATPALANKPILILTGSFEPFDEDKAKNCGADDFLAKPFESQQIITKVKELAELGASRERSALAAQTPFQPAESAPATAFIPSVETVAVPAFAQQPQAQTVTPSDIWGAFTPDVESSVATTAVPAATAVPPAEAPFEFYSEPDVFAVVNEESDSQLVQPSAVSGISPQQTGSQWIPVEEHTFEFEEETVSELPPTIFTKQALPAMNSAFGDISFEDDEPAPTSPILTHGTPIHAPITQTTTSVFSAPEPNFSSIVEPVSSVASFEEPTQSSQTPAHNLLEPAGFPVAEVPAVAALTEEQLKAALSAASKEVIERIVWEVVPDLAEALIKEAIRKIKDGQ